jgi:hypothetical protein
MNRTENLTAARLSGGTAPSQAREVSVAVSMLRQKIETGVRRPNPLTHREPRSRISAQRRCRSSLTEDMRQSATGTGIIATCPKGCNPAL